MEDKKINWNDKDEVMDYLKWISENSALTDKQFGKISVSLRDDEDVVKLALKCGLCSWGYLLISDRLRANKEILFLAIESWSGAAISYFDINFRSDREAMLYAVKHGGEGLGILKIADKKLRDTSGRIDDEELLVESLKVDFTSLDQASERLKKNPNVLAVAREKMQQLKPAYLNDGSHRTFFDNNEAYTYKVVNDPSIQRTLGENSSVTLGDFEDIYASVKETLKLFASKLINIINKALGKDDDYQK